MFIETNLMRAVERGKFDEIREILQNEEKECTSCIGTVCLCKACAMNRNDIVELLLQHGANPDYQLCKLHSGPLKVNNPIAHTERVYDNNYWQAIQLVNVTENDDTSSEHADNDTPPASRTPSVTSGSPVATSSCHMNVMVGFQCVQLPLIVACKSKIDFDIIKQLVEAGASVNAKDAGGQTALHAAAESQNVDVVQYLLEHNASVDIASDFQAKTPLANACTISKYPQVIRTLIAAGSDVGNLGILGQRPLYEAILNPFIGREAVQILIDAGADLRQDYYMIVATTEGSCSTMETLHKHGAPTDPGVAYKSALHAACKRTSVSVDRVLMLLAWGADVNRICPYGGRPLEFACQDFQLEKIRVLMGWGANLNISGCLTVPSWSWHLDWCNQYIAMMKLLIAGGLRMDSNLCQAIVTYVGRLPGRKGVRAKVISFLKSLAHTIPKLSDLCRLKIRNCLAPKIDENVNKLEMLPESIRSFLCLKDLVGASNNGPSKRRRLQCSIYS